MELVCLFFSVLVGYGKLVNCYDFISDQNVFTVCMSIVSLPQPFPEASVGATLSKTLRDGEGRWRFLLLCPSSKDSGSRIGSLELPLSLHYTCSMLLVCMHTGIWKMETSQFHLVHLDFTIDWWCMFSIL